MRIRRTIHMCIDIAGLERMSNYRLNKMAPEIKVDGVPLANAKEVRNWLRELRAEGLSFIPLGGCDNYDKCGKCQGHEIRDT